MQDIKEFYILGEPIETEIGKFEFLKVKEYPNYFIDLQTVSLSKDKIIIKYGEINKSGDLDEFLNELKQCSLYEIVTQIPELNQSYSNLMLKLLNNEDGIKLVNSENFDYVRNLVMEMNFQKEEKVNPNLEIQRAIERSRRVKSQDSENLEFVDIVSSMVGFNGLSYKDINEFTIYQLYMTYYRIAQIKNYDTSTLFATVSPDKIKIDSWSKHINPFEDEKHFVSQDEFKKGTGSVFNE